MILNPLPRPEINDLATLPTLPLKHERLNENYGFEIRMRFENGTFEIQICLLVVVRQRQIL